MDIREVIDGLNAKMIRRHPHIFGEQHAETIDDLNTIWLEAKQQEGKTPRVKFEKVFADHFMSLYDKTKNKDFDENMLKSLFTARRGRVMRLDKYFKGITFSKTTYLG